jgi:hypothetical protein
MAITINSSIRVKPFSFFAVFNFDNIIALLYKLDNPTTG